MDRTARKHEKVEGVIPQTRHQARHTDKQTEESGPSPLKFLMTNFLAAAGLLAALRGEAWCLLIPLLELVRAEKLGLVSDSVIVLTPLSPSFSLSTTSSTAAAADGGVTVDAAASTPPPPSPLSLSPSSLLLSSSFSSCL